MEHAWPVGRWREVRPGRVSDEWLREFNVTSAKHRGD
jgi:hypothetical protein